MKVDIGKDRPETDPSIRSHFVPKHSNEVEYTLQDSKGKEKRI